MPFFLWSRTPASNGTADPTCPWPEGMAPAQVNDSARGNMARLREFADDIAGAIVTAGTNAAYTVASYEGFDTLAHLGGNVIAFTPHTGNASPVTLNVDGLGARPLRLAPGVEVPAATLVQGTPYVAFYNAADGAFYLRGFLNLPYSVPIGGLMPFLSATVPNSNFVLPYGQALSRATYAALFALVGTTFGSGDGSTTFNIPDLRGRYIGGLDTMGGVAAGRLTAGVGGVDGTATGGFGGAQSTTLSTLNLPPYTPSGSIALGGYQALTVLQFMPGTGTGGTGAAINSTGVNVYGASFTASFSGAAQGGSSNPFTNLPPSIVLPYILRVI